MLDKVSEVSRLSEWTDDRGYSQARQNYNLDLS